MLDSQLATLEVPTPDEGEVASVKLGQGDRDADEVGLKGVSNQVIDVARKWVGPNGSQ